MTVREQTQQIEKETLSKYACLSQNTRGRAVPEEECPLRTPFQRDRDRVIHCKAFRRLKQKTQVFISPEGDHYRTRLTHTLEVSQIARTMARALRLNEDLTEAIALGHDLGHTPFGHAGERALNALNPNGFRHYEQSVRVVEVLEKNFEGLNLTFEVRDGIDRHTGGEWAVTQEGQLVRYADRIAYINHDIEDSITAGILTPAELPKSAVALLGNTKSARISALITSLVENSGETIQMGPAVFEQYNVLHAFMYSAVYKDSKAKEEEYKVDKLIEELYRHFKAAPAEMPPFYGEVAEREGIDRAVTDYISGMSDEYATRIFENLFVPKKWQLAF